MPLVESQVEMLSIHVGLELRSGWVAAFGNNYIFPVCTMGLIIFTLKLEREDQ